MITRNYFVKKFQKFNLFINSQLEKYLNKLNFNNLLKQKSNIIIVIEFF